MLGSRKAGRTTARAGFDLEDPDDTISRQCDQIDAIVRTVDDLKDIPETPVVQNPPGEFDTGMFGHTTTRACA